MLISPKDTEPKECVFTICLIRGFSTLFTLFILGRKVCRKLVTIYHSQQWNNKKRIIIKLIKSVVPCLWFPILLEHKIFTRTKKRLSAMWIWSRLNRYYSVQVFSVGRSGIMKTEWVILGNSKVCSFAVRCTVTSSIGRGLMTTVFKLWSFYVTNSTRLATTNFQTVLDEITF